MKRTIQSLSLSLLTALLFSGSVSAAPALPQLDPAVMAWTIAGWHQAKILALLESLPKAARKALSPLEHTALELANRTRPFGGAMLPALEKAIYEQTGERVGREAWDLRASYAYNETEQVGGGDDGSVELRTVAHKFGRKARDILLDRSGQQQAKQKAYCQPPKSPRQLPTGGPARKDALEQPVAYRCAVAG